jgi:serine protease Do
MKHFRAPAGALAFAVALAGSPLLAPSRAQAKDASPAIELARQLNKAFIEVADSVSPSVVVISVAQKQGPEMALEGHPFFEQLPDWWKEQFKEYQDRRQQKPQPKEEDDDSDRRFNGQGSGIVLREDGYILTNNHVVQEAERIRVKLKDGREFDAEVRGMDRESDLAVIRLKEKATGLVPARFADSDKVRVGEFAIAIGAPYDLEYSVTFGHVSAKGREDIAGGMMDQNFIQTDANINPGNSGGPLVNIEGEVIGINSMIRGLRTGIGFAIPSNLAREISDRLIADGRFARSWLGVGGIRSLRDDREMRDSVTGVKDGVVVGSVLADGPAYKSDLQPLDVITSVDGHPITSVQQLRTEVTRKKPGAEVVLDVHRDGKNLKVRVTPEAMPDRNQLVVNRGGRGGEKGPRAEASATEFGLTVKPVTKELAKQYGFEASTSGLVVTEVAPDSPAAREGFRPGDVITDVGAESVESVKDFREAVKAARGKGRLKLKFLRDGDRQSALVKVRGE